MTSSWDDSPSYDEPEHVTAGYTYVQTGTFWMNPWHPPLVKALSGLTLSLFDWRRPVQHWEAHDKWSTIYFFFFTSGNDPQDIIRLARAPLILGAAAFCLAYFFLLRRHIDPSVALLAAALLCTSPTYIAHARLVTTDVPCAAACFLCLSALIEHLRHPRPRTLIGLGLATGVALLVKYSALLLGPVYLLRGGWGRPARQSLRDGLVISLLAASMVWVVYAAVPAPLAYQEGYNEVMLGDNQNCLVRVIIASQESPLLHPWSWYGTGLYSQTRHVTTGHDKPSFLRNNYYTGGRWDYFPTVFAAKEPVGHLVLLVGALLMGPVLLRAGGGGPSDTLRTYLLFVLTYLVVALPANLNIGVRHLLPIYPCLYALTAWVWVEAARRFGRPVFVTAVSLCLLWSTLSVAAAWPGLLSYFNEWVGGKKSGPAITLDSNFDWGVDLNRLRVLLDRSKTDHIYLLYWGTSDPAAYLGNRYRPFPGRTLPAGEIIGVSVNHYVNLQMAAQDLAPPPANMPDEVVSWLLSLNEVGRAGDTILLLQAK